MDINDLAEIIASVGITFLLIFLVAFIVVRIAIWKIFTKAGKPGWKSIIPIYWTWVLIEIAGLEWWWFLLAISSTIVSLLGLDDLVSLTSLISWFATFNCYYNIAKKFNKTTGVSVAVGIFSGIFVLIFGFSKNEVYDGNIPVSKNGVFGNPEVNHNNTNSSASSSPASNNQDYVFCSGCGTKMLKDTKFCANCGKENK